ncbi:MAG TPA: hypothetical protein VIY86_01985 [Pirellulaceae bacterium]
MRRGMSVVVALLFCGALAPNVFGLPEFKKAFTQKYAGENVPEDFKKLLRKTNCNVCHVARKPKQERNAYGEALANLIPGDAADRKKTAKKEGKDKEVTAEILKEFEDALTKVEAEKNSAGETFGDRLKSGKLPVE